MTHKRHKIVRLPTSHVRHTVAALAASSIIQEIAQEIAVTLSEHLANHPDMTPLLFAHERYLVRLDVLVDIGENQERIATLFTTMIFPEDTPTLTPSETRTSD
jgi:hypothetical protein